VDPLYLAFQLALAGRYSIDRELGRGGMGIVFLAKEVHLDRPVAIKLLPPDRAGQPLLRERFLREARMAAKLSHPNIIPIHAVEETAGFVYYVMAFVDGESLAHRVRERGPLSGTEGARVLREVAWALAYAHDQGIVHRDVKPDNILLETSTGRVLVADFGIAAAAGESGPDGIAGTPEFMSPEQALGGNVEARSDIYGLGATAYYALSGQIPFDGQSATEILAKHVTEAPPALASLGLSVPRKLASVIDRCLSKDPEHRPSTAQTLAEQLGVALEQRRELPAALRAFVKRDCRLNGGGTLIAGFALLPAASGMAWLFGNQAGYVTFALGLTVAPLGYLVYVARRLSALGFSHHDVGPAFRAEMEQAREELAVARRNVSTRLEKVCAGIAKVSAGFAALGAAGLAASALFGGKALLEIAVQVFVPSNGIAMISTLAMIALRQRHRDVDTEFWSKIWTGRIGKVVFGVARKLLGRRAPQSAMTHRATELSLRMAAEELFDSLPSETQRALGDLPVILRRLQDDAQALRTRYDDLQEALSNAGTSASSAELDDVRATRDSIHAKLGEAVGALETIRLNLLRLHAGSATIDGLTTHLGFAAEVSDQLARLIAAHEEVEQTIKIPLRSRATA
jgi:serine/threonine-protein kinase